MVIEQVINGYLCEMEPLGAYVEPGATTYYYSPELAIEKLTPNEKEFGYFVYFNKEWYKLPEWTNPDNFHENRLKCVERLTILGLLEAA